MTHARVNNTNKTYFYKQLIFCFYAPTPPGFKKKRKTKPKKISKTDL